METRHGSTSGILALAISLAVAMPGSAQLTGLENGQWRYFIGDAGATRSNPHLTQVTASNFGDLEVAWIWRGDNFGGQPTNSARPTPIYVDGMLYTVAGTRRQVVAMDPATGETIWTFREPETTRYLRSPRANHGKGVGYGEIDGRGVIYITTPAYFLWALDAKTGRPLENWGTPVSLPGFETGVVDLVPDLIGDWGPWQNYVAAGGTYDPDLGIPQELGMVTSSSPPIVVNGVIVAQTAHEPAYGQTRIENVPGDLSGYDARTGRHLWKFHVLPRPGQFGHDTWENDAWQWSGNMGQWAPASADPELGLVYLVTNASTIESFTGHRPGNNLFGGSVLALDVQTGQRRWHFQIHHSDRWNYDLPAAPILLDLNVPGRGQIPALIQNTKQGLVFAFNRATGEPIWPIVERPVPQTQIPGDWTSPTQPYPTLPAPLDSIVLDGLTDKYIMDYTPELKARAMEILSLYDIGGTYAPPLPYNHNNSYIAMINCGMSGLNIPTPAVADPTTNIMYASHTRRCGTSGFMSPTNGVDEPVTEYAAPSGGTTTPTTGRTVVPWLPGGDDPGLGNIDGLPVYKPFGGIVAIDMDTGQKLWDMPVGETPANIRNHPLLAGVNIPNTGAGGGGIQMVMGDLLLQTGGGTAGVLNARDKRTGEIVATTELPANGSYGMMAFMHEGKQYIVVNVSGGGMPAGYAALALPD